MVTIAEASGAQGKIIVLAIDELQYLKDDELAALITAVHRINQQSLPFGFFGAGLPQVLAKAGNAKSYAERLFQFVEIGALDAADARRAIEEPVRAANAAIETDALDMIVSKTQGYPFFLQEWGFRCWNQARQSPITRTDAIDSEQRVIDSLDKSFFRVRFDRLTPTEQLYLRAMAELGPGPHRSGEVASVLGKQAQQTAPARAKVIAKGMAYGGQHGMVHFSVPLFDEFMRREMPEFSAKAAKNAAPAKARRRRKK